MVSSKCLEEALRNALLSRWWRWIFWLKCRSVVTLTRKCPQSLHPHRGEQRKFRFWVNHSFTSVSRRFVREMSCVRGCWRFILANIKRTSRARWAPHAPLFPLWQQRAECTDVGGVLQGTLFFTHLLTSCSHYLHTKKGKKNPISGTFWVAPYSRPLRFSVPKLQGVTNMLFRLNEFTINKGQFAPLFTFGLDWHFYCPCSSHTQP